MTQIQIEKVGALDRIATLRRLANRLEQRSERILRQRYGLSWPQFQVLRELSVEKPTMLQHVNNAVYCTRGNLAAIVDRLERDGWLIRLRRQGDRRVVLLGLTEKGAQIRRIEGELAAEISAWLRPVEREVGQVGQMLNDLLQELTDPQALRAMGAGNEMEAAAAVELSVEPEWLAGDA